MTIQHSDDDLQPALPDDASPTGGDALAEVRQLRRPGPYSSRPPRRPADYRLRGLDLDAQSVAPSTTRPTGRRHPAYRRRRRRRIVQLLIVLVVIAATTTLVRGAVVQPYEMTSASMAPTFEPGTDLVVMKPRLLAGSIEQGDVIVFRQPAGTPCGTGEGGTADLVKRVIAMPGDTISSAYGNIYVNGRLLDDGWHNETFGPLAATRLPPMQIPEGSYYVLGDNRTDTCDSRVFGPIDGSLLVGKVVATVGQSGQPFLRLI
jgi:signal peptidase I